MDQSHRLLQRKRRLRLPQRKPLGQKKERRQPLRLRPGRKRSLRCTTPITVRRESRTQEPNGGQIRRGPSRAVQRRRVREDPRRPVRAVLQRPAREDLRRPARAVRQRLVRYVLRRPRVKAAPQRPGSQDLPCLVRAVRRRAYSQSRRVSSRQGRCAPRVVLWQHRARSVRHNRALPRRSVVLCRAR